MTIHHVSGPPCSGKSTYVDEHADPNAVVLDLDRLAHALGYPTEHVDWSDPEVHPARSAAMIARTSLLKRAHSLGPEVWVISTEPPVGRSGDVEMVELDPGVDECVARAERAGRSPATLEQIHRWYAGRHVGTTSQAW